MSLSPGVLSRYVGSYEYRLPENPAARRVLQVMMVDGQLFVENNRALVALSPTTFALTRGAARIDMVLDDTGRATEMIVQRQPGCGGSSGVAASFSCGETAGPLKARRTK